MTHRYGAARSVATPGGAQGRRGVTLVELLVVVLVLVILMGAAIPLLRQPLADRKLREAARQVTAFLSVAQSQAAERGRPVAVMFLRASGDPSNPDINSCYEMVMAESPPPYLGDVANAAIADIRFRNWNLPAVPPSTLPPHYQATGGDAWDALATFDSASSPSMGVQFDPGNPNVPVPLVLPGDLIQFNNKGPYYRIKHVYSTATNWNPNGAVNQYQIVFSPTKANPDARRPDALIHPSIPLGTPNVKAPVRFKILRQPLRSSVTPVELPTNTILALGLSGVRADDFAYNPMLDAAFNNINPPALNFANSPITISFSPEGGVEQVFRDHVGEPPQGPIYLLIGRADLNDNQPSLDQQNLNDLSAIWVTVHPGTGAIKTSENASLASPPGAVTPNNIRDARRFARTAESAGAS